MSDDRVHPIFAPILKAISGDLAREPFPQLLPRGLCKACDEARDRGDKMMPPHHASSRCESGKRPHCTCDTCF